MLRNGFFPSAPQDGRAGWLAVNSFDETESNLLFEESAAPLPERTARPAWASLGSWPLWRNLAIAALTLFTLEWSLFHRRRTE